VADHTRGDLDPPARTEILFPIAYLAANATQAGVTESVDALTILQKKLGDGPDAVAGR